MGGLSSRIKFSFFITSLIALSLLGSLWVPFSAQAGSATLYLSPASGTFTVDSTFTVSVFLNTNSEFINALDVSLQFPPDRLQVVSPSSGKSIIEIWTAQPSFDNQTGRIRFQGGIPNPGIKTNNGVISTITFRVKSTGKAIIKFAEGSKVLLNDGLGTDILGNTSSGIYDFILPPPAGPAISSSSHSDQGKWYNNPNALLSWTNNFEVDGYSYMLNKDPVDIPDDVSEGSMGEVIYRNLTSGTHFFHIKALRNGSWGGVSHFALNIDVTPPADFPIEISPDKRTTNHSPLISFSTTDSDSGIDHYELKLISLSRVMPSQEQTFFIEANSPYTPTLELGSYQVIVRAFDKAANYREVKEKLEIVQPLFEFVRKEGIRLYGAVVVPWVWVFLAALIALLLLVLLGRKLWKWHRYVETKLVDGALSDPVIQARLKELKNKQKQYAKSAVFLLMVALSLFSSGFSAFAKEKVELSPPIVTLVANSISNEELFYIGGKTGVANSQVVVYLQSLHTGETFSETVNADIKGEWFYSHQSFLVAGQYLVWVQSRVINELSPPSPQINLTVSATALQFGASRLSVESVYFLIAMILLLLLTGLIIFNLYHFYHGRKKHSRLLKEIKEAEESLRRGFALLRRDIEAELLVIQKAKLKGEVRKEQQDRERQLLNDLESVRQHVAKEIWDIENLT